VTGPSSAPRGEHTPRPGVTWVTSTVGWSGKQLVDDDAPRTPTEPRHPARGRARSTEDEVARPCEQHPHAPVIGGLCGGCTQYPADMVKPSGSAATEATGPATPDDTRRDNT
jgi:hypothetical protein